MTLPEDFVKYTRSLMGDDLWHELEEGLASEAPVSVRINPLKWSGGNTSVVNMDGGVPWCGNGFYLGRRPAFTFDPLLHAGLYYVQDASSMFVERILRQYVNTPVMMLDLCAAPGGKSTLARTALPEGSLLFCNEPVHVRSMILAENVQKLGHTDVIVTNNYPADYKKAGLMFDVVLADVPCSGEGMFRKDAGAREEWSVQNVNKCRALQRDIVGDIWNCLKPGGLFIYSTCTFNAGEDEENVRFVAEELGAEVLPVDVEASWGITGSLLKGFDVPVYRFIPGKTRGEGLFIAVLRKSGESEDDGTGRCGRKKRKGEAKRGRDVMPAEAEGWIKSIDDYDVRYYGNVCRAVPRRWSNVYDMAVNSLKVIHAGIAVGEIKGKDIVPSQSLLLSEAFCRDAFECVELGHADAVSFLRKEPIALPEGVRRGYVVMTYGGYPIGFEKNIGNRANNLYPAEWKIKTTHPAETGWEVLKINMKKI